MKYETSCRIAMPMVQSEVKRKLRNCTSRLTQYCYFQVDDLERDAFEVLRLVRSIKNSFAPINRIPPEILSLIPDYYCEGDVDKDLIALTHVCRGWRDAFISRSSLWTLLDFTNIDKTRTYIERSQSSPLKFYLSGHEVIDDASALVAPHIHRLKSLTIDSDVFPSVLEHIRSHAPLLEELDIDIRFGDPILANALFDGDLSSLRTLRLYNIVSDLPWENLANPRAVDLKFYDSGCGTTKLLDFLESAPLLHTVALAYPLPDSPNIPHKRIVAIPRLKSFYINTTLPHSILLHHLHIPAGASLISEFRFEGEESPLLRYLPCKSPDPNYLSHITSINLLFDSQQLFTQLSGPSGSLRALVGWRASWDSKSVLAGRILCSFDPSILSTTQRLVISGYRHIGPANGERPTFQMLSSMNNLRTLILIDCEIRPFISAMNPERNSSDLILCLNMEELVICSLHLSLFRFQHIVRMAKIRAFRGAKLSSITFIDTGGHWPRKEVSKLREHVTHLEHRVSDKLPAWDYSGSEWV